MQTQTQMQDWQKSLKKKGDPVEREASDQSVGYRHYALTNMKTVELKDIMFYCKKGFPLHNVKCSNPGCKQGKLCVTTETKMWEEKDKRELEKGQQQFLHALLCLHFIGKMQWCTLQCMH